MKSTNIPEFHIPLESGTPIIALTNKGINNKARFDGGVVASESPGMRAAYSVYGDTLYTVSVENNMHTRVDMTPHATTTQTITGAIETPCGHLNDQHPELFSNAKAFEYVSSDALHFSGRETGQPRQDRVLWVAGEAIGALATHLAKVPMLSPDRYSRMHTKIHAISVHPLFALHTLSEHIRRSSNREVVVETSSAVDRLLGQWSDNAQEWATNWAKSHDDPQPLLNAFHDAFGTQLPAWAQKK